MLSRRGAETAEQLDIPWRFVPGGNRYDPDTNPSGLISFATAENALVQQELEDFANNNVHIPGLAFTYRYSTAGGPRFPAALAAFLNEYFHPCKPLTGSNVQITSAATALHEILAFSLADPGQGILTSRPCYGRFELDFGNKAHLKLVYPETYAETCFHPDVVHVYEEALLKSNAEGVTIRALLVVNPHNPLGRCYPKETLIALMSLCEKHKIHFISDEVYALSVFDSGEPDTIPFTSALSINPSGVIDEDLLHVTYAMSKDFGAAGLRRGALITKNTALQNSLTSIIRFHSPSGMSIAIGTVMLEDREWCRNFISLSQKRIAEAYRFVTDGLRKIGVKYLAGANAGFFIWIDLSPYLPPGSETKSPEEREFALAQKLVDAGVFLHPGEEHSLMPGWFRLVYTQERRIVEKGLERLESVISRK
ncbi:PLP-dependent transferase [Zopfia rhizophila CBS 207.26]|uniref:PLP-dependent transferase n=1 Tax=Zopfia rhizophila CBS 207.26 TaxID=1314779 RepID=A0A6A6DWH7_9PEZI|nr:PLP-dependent transferase [Zopfia rhizophila CBS 207.26]